MNGSGDTWDPGDAHLGPVTLQSCRPNPLPIVLWAQKIYSPGPCPDVGAVPGWTGRPMQ